MLTRRDLLRFAGVGFSGLLIGRWQINSLLSEFPKYERLGRVAVGKVELKARPDESSQTLGVLYEDAVLPWLREITGRKPGYLNQRWVETPDGYLYSSNIQPVRNNPNIPVSQLMQTQLGEGMWVEVTVPFVDVLLQTEPSSNSWVAAKIEQGLPLRLYYEQVFWVDRIKVDAQGQVLYRVNPNYYGGVDMLWAPAEAFRSIKPEDIAPINPEAEQKRIVVDLIQQSLSCFEGKREVFYCRVSSGAKFDAFGNSVEKWATPVGKHKVSRKYLTLQMSGGTTGASYDLPGIGWTTIFVTGGVAVHSTFWHNDFGVPRSHGCVNVTPQHARWIFRWTEPYVTYDIGMTDVSLTGEASTPIAVIES